jgi:hypothetical protein
MNDQPDNQIEIVASGTRYTFVAIALAKRALQTPGIKTGDKLHILEMINGWAGPDILAMIDPMSDLEFQIFREAKSLDIEGGNLSPAQKTQASFDILTGAVFPHFVALNPGIANAIRWRGPSQSATAPQTSAPDGSASQPASGDGPKRYHIDNVPTQTTGPASTYSNPEPYWNRPERERQQFAEGTPNNKPFNPFTGR